MAITDYGSYDALGLAELVAQRDVKPSELLEEAINRAEAMNPSSDWPLPQAANTATAKQRVATEQKCGWRMVTSAATSANHSASAAASHPRVRIPGAGDDLVENATEPRLERAKQRASSTPALSDGQI